MLSEGFEILKLPNSSDRTQEAVPTAAPGQRLYLGISHSSITTATLSPPRVESAYSISPDAVVTAVAAKSQFEIAFILSERNKSLLRLVSGETVTLPSLSSHLLYTNGVFTVIFEDQTVCGYDACLNKLWESNLSGLPARRTKRPAQKLLFSAVVEKGALGVVTQNPKSGEVTLNIIEAFSDGMSVIKSSVLSVGGALPLFSYADGILYCCQGQDCKISMVSVATGQVLKMFNITGSGITQITALERQNLVVAQGNLVTLLDCRYVAQISQRHYADLRLIAAYVQPSNTLIAIIGKSVMAINVQTSKSTLIESIGKGIQQPEPHTGEFCNLFKVVMKNVDSFGGECKNVLQAAQTEYSQVFNDLTAANKAQNGDVLRKFITYCQSPDLTWKETPIAQDPEDPMIYDDHDRQLDVELVRLSCRIAFGYDASDKKVRGPGEWVPYHVMFYLVSHPLFPSADPEFLNLLSIVTEPRLYHQAILTLPYIQPRDLLAALLSEDTVIFIDAATRLGDNFSSAQIRDCARDVFNASQNSVSMVKLVNRLSKHSETWQILAPFIDAVSLLSWTPESLKKVKARLSKEALALHEQISMTNVLKELLRSANINTRTKVLGDHLLHLEPDYKTRKVHIKPKSEDTVVKLPLYTLEKLTIG